MSSRDQFLAETEHAIADGAPGALVGMLHIHLRRVRQLAVALGHALAAAVPDAVELRLAEVLRGSDRVCRIGENDFLVLIPNLLSPGHAELAAQRLLREFERPLLVLERPLAIAVAIGLAWTPEHARTADDLSRRATAAVDAALAVGSRLSLAVGAAEDALLVDDLRDALVNNELSIEFQPIVALRKNRIVAVEALARWQCPRRGMVAPQRFVPMAEQGGLAAELTRWTLHAGLREYAQLRGHDPNLRCAINLSPRVFSESGLVEQVGASLAIWGVPPSSVILEVTETAVMEDPEYSARALRGLRDTGVGIAIDDFGKGYSSFAYLKHFPATELKIDKSFVADIVRDERSSRLVRSMIDLAHSLGLSVTSEGVEDENTAQRLREMDCDHAQGFHLGRPRPREQWIAEYRARAAGEPAMPPVV
jgi:EAL domain-containing protein (putative c-di-GMP-specific phosphodiesterase class I)